MNLLMLDERTAIVERTQTPLIRLLESEGFEVIAVPIRHARTLGGAVHCVTLDFHATRLAGPGASERSRPTTILAASARAL